MHTEVIKWWEGVPEDIRRDFVKRSQSLDGAKDLLGNLWGGAKNYWNKMEPGQKATIKNVGIGAGASLIPWAIRKLMTGKGGLGSLLGTTAAGGALGYAYKPARKYLEELWARAGDGQDKLGPAEAPPAEAPATTAAPAALEVPSSDVVANIDAMNANAPKHPGGLTSNQQRAFPTT